MVITGDPHADFDAYENERHRAFIQLPVCECCGERIQTEQLYDFDGELICEDCLIDYVNENYKKNTNEYIDEFED